MRKLFFLILVVVPIVFLSGCLDDEVTTISFDANSGKYRDNSTVKYGYYPDRNTYVALPCAQDADFSRWCAGNYPMKDGHLFIDWNSKKDGSGLSFSMININSLGSGATFYAHWLPDNGGYTIHFDTEVPNLAVPSITGVSPNIEATLPTDADVIREGYKLLGWELEYFVSPGISSRRIYTNIFKLSDYSLKNVYLDAIWYKLPESLNDICTVNFDTRGGVLEDPSVLTQEVPCGSEIALPSATKNDSSLIGWFSHYYFDVFVYPGKYSVMTNITLHAVWDNDGL